MNGGEPKAGTLHCYCLHNVEYGRVSMCHATVNRCDRDYSYLVSLFPDGIGYSVKQIYNEKLSNLFLFQHPIYHKIDSNGVWYSSVYKSGFSPDPHYRIKNERHAGYHLTTKLGVRAVIREMLWTPCICVILKVKVLGFRSYGWAGKNVPSLYCHRYKPLSIIATKDTTVETDLPIERVDSLT